MKIAQVDIYAYKLTYAHGEYVMSGGRAASSQESTAVRLRTDAGIEGWGEVATLGGTYLPAFAGGVRAALVELAPHLIGLDPCSISQVNRVLDGLLLGQQAAKSPIDIACWDILGKAAGMPVARLLGGVLQQDFPLYEAIPLGAPKEMAGFAASRQAEGVNAFQVKVGNEPRQDIARMRTVLDAVEPETVLVADANGGWDLARAQIAMRDMQGMPVFVEQPCRALEDCAIVQRASSLPLSLDESVTAAGDLHRAKYEAGACAVNIKLSRVGGLSRAAAMRDHACGLAMRVSLEDTWGGDLTTAAVSHLAASTPPEHLLLVSFMNDWTNEHLAGHLPRSAGGRGSAPSGAGLGVEVDLSQLASRFSP